MTHDREGAAPGARPPAPSPVDVREHGLARDGVAQVTDRRLFMQLLVFDVPADRDPTETARALAALLEARGMAAVVYADVNHPRGLGLLTWSEDPAHFVTRVRPLFGEAALQGVVFRPEFTMFGRSYASGYEPRLEWWLLDRPRETVTHGEWPWAVWYPLRRSGEFARLDPKEQGAILREHGTIGMAYGAQDLAHDVRLACHGLDAHDNEFVIGLVGRELHPLSHVVQSMRKTRQTAEYITQMGPFFVGYALHRLPGA